MAAYYFGSRYFAAGYFGGAAERGGYFGAGYFGANHFRAGFYGPVTITSGGINAILDATEAADTLESTTTITVVEEVDQGFGGPRHRVIRPRLEPIVAVLDIRERPDTCEATATLGFDPVAMDNDLLLIAA
jgi:hypothetical protein